MSLHRNILIFGFVLFQTVVFGQQTELSLIDCLELSDKNEKIQVTQQGNLKRSQIGYKFGKLGFLPTISASPNYNISFGRKLDPFTNSFGNQTVYSNSFSLVSQLTLFQFLKYYKQNQYNETTVNNTKVDLERTKEKNRSTVFEKCINIWKLQLKIEQQIKILTNTQNFKQRQKELVAEGKIRSLDTLETSINYKNQTIGLLKLKRELSYETVNLNYYLGLPLLQETKLKSFTLETEKEFLYLDEFYQLQDIQNKLILTDLQYKIDQTQFYPSLSTFGNLGTGYSTNNKDNTSTIIPYGTQISNNAYQGIGFTLNVPIFNKGEYFRKQQIYTITKEEQQQLLENKHQEIEKKKIEIQLQRSALNELLVIQKAIAIDKETIYKASQLLYFEGKIRLSELEKVETDFNNFIQTLQDIEIELFKLNSLKLSN